MPELPEVEHLRRTLGPLLEGRRVTGTRLRRPDICASPGGRAPTARDLLLHAVLSAPSRRGKQLALVAGDGRALVVRLGMTGQLLVIAPGEAPRRTDHVHARWSLDDGSTLVFRDPRRFGGLAPFATPDALERAWAALGPDALTLADHDLGRALSRTTRAVKAALLDQSLIAGVGNIYADESLFRAGIHPLRRAREIPPPDVARLGRAIREVLAAAIRHGGSTLRDYVDARGDAGRHQLAHRVYGRGGLPCVRCRQKLRVARIAQRTTVFCPACQPRRPSPPHGRFPHSRAAAPGPGEYHATHADRPGRTRSVSFLP